ncbi:MAG: AAA family ATPase [Myxococcota bacterium]
MPLGLIGRHTAAQRLEFLLGRIRSGRGTLVFLRGEAGIGKSTVAEALAASAEELGYGVFWGRCWEAGGAPPLWPWIQIARSLTADPSADPLAGLSPSQASFLAELLPELRVRQPSLSEAPLLEPEQARFQIMDAAVELLLSASRERPILVLLEDVHAIDETSALLLQFLAPRTSTAALMVLATVRDAEKEARPSEEVMSVVLRRYEHVVLSRWNAEDVASYLSSVGVEMSRTALATLIETTEGHPLFVVEAARLMAQRPELAEGVAPLPVGQGIRSVLHERLAACRPDVRRLLEIASIIGREFTAKQVAGLASISLPEASGLLKEAVDHHVLMERRPELYRFHHILMRDVLCDGLSVEAQQALHLAVARSLEATSDAGWADLAHHYMAAGPEHGMAAARAAERAADAALRQYAFTDAIRFQVQALSALEGASAGPDVRCDALLKLARCRMMDGAVEAGRRTCLTAVELARRLGRWDLLAQAALEYGAVYVYAEVDLQLVQLLDEALQRLNPEQSALRARVLSRYASALQPAQDPEEPIRMAREAIALARSSGDQEALLATLGAGISAIMDLGEPAERRTLNEDHVRLAGLLREPVHALRGHLRLCCDFLEMGDMGALDRSLAAAGEHAALLMHPHYTWSVMGLRAMRAIFEGRFSDAAEHAEQTKRLAEQAEDPNAVMTVLFQTVYHLRTAGQDEAALEALSAARAACRGTLAQRLIEILSASTEWRLGRPLHAVRPRWMEYTLRYKDSSFLSAMTDVAVAVQHPQSHVLYDALWHRQRTFSSGGLMAMASDGPMARCAGLLADQLGRWEAAQAHFQSALDVCHATGARPFWVRTARDFGRACRRRGDPRAQELLASSAELARELGMAPEPGDPGAARAPQGPARLAQQGDAWIVEAVGLTARVSDRKGLRLLARLVEQPGQAIHALDLDSGGAPAARDLGDAGEHLDEAARSAYRARIASLQAELDEAETWSDLGRAERARGELELLQRELSRAVGLGGRTRRAADPAERSRVNVQRRIRDAIRRIEEVSPLIGRHFQRSVKTGVYCVYQPE